MPLIHPATSSLPTQHQNPNQSTQNLNKVDDGFFSGSSKQSYIHPSTFPQIPSQSDLPSIDAPLRTDEIQIEHGQARPDPYRWMHDTKHPRMQSLIQQAKANESAFFQAITGLKQKLADRMLALINESYKQVPWKSGDFKYFTMREAGQQHIKFYRLGVGESEEESLLMDNNALAQGKDYCEVNHCSPSPDGKTIAYLIDEDGSQTMSIALSDLTVTKDPITNYSQLRKLCLNQGSKDIKTFEDIIWSPDSSGFYFTVLNERQCPDRVMFHELNSGKSTEVYHELEAERWLTLEKTRDKENLLINSDTSDSTKYYMIPMGAQNGENLQLLHQTQNHLKIQLEADEKHYYALVSRNGDNRQLYRMDRHIDSVDLDAAEKLISGEKNSELEWISLQAEHVLLGKRINGAVQIHVYDKSEKLAKDSNQIISSQESLRPYQSATAKTDDVVNLSDFGLYNGRTINFPDKQYHVTLNTDQYEDHKLHISYESPTTPKTDFEFNCKNNELSVIQQDQFTDFSPADYQSKMCFAKAKDGTQIPVSLFYHKDTPQDGRAPLKLTSYGAYGLLNEETFSPAAIALAEQGMVLATAHVRGGGIYGRQWYEAGKMLNKINTFTDTLDAANWLIQNNYTQPDKMALYGGSAGGLPVGYALNNAPELFCAVIADVPFVDVLTDMFDEQLPLTQEEWQEWGDPRKKNEYDYMKSYSPIDNIKTGEYPAVLIIGGVNDGQVPFREPAKLFAHLQHHKTDNRPLIFHVNEKSGHHGDAGLYSALAESALKNAFALWMTQSESLTAPNPHQKKTNIGQENL